MVALLFCGCWGRPMYRYHVGICIGRLYFIFLLWHANHVGMNGLTYKFAQNNNIIIKSLIWGYFSIVIYDYIRFGWRYTNSSSERPCQHNYKRVQLSWHSDTAASKQLIIILETLHSHKSTENNNDVDLLNWLCSILYHTMNKSWQWQEDRRPIL